MFFIDKLVTMGARVIFCDPHRAVISGRRRLHGARMESPTSALGMQMFIAAFAPRAGRSRRHLPVDAAASRWPAPALASVRTSSASGLSASQPASLRRPNTDTPTHKVSAVIHPLPPGMRDVLPTRCASCARLSAGWHGLRRRRLRRGLDPRARVREVLQQRRRRRGWSCVPPVRRPGPRAGTSQPTTTRTRGSSRTAWPTPSRRSACVTSRTPTAPSSAAPRRHASSSRAGWSWSARPRPRATPRSSRSCSRRSPRRG